MKDKYKLSTWCWIKHFLSNFIRLKLFPLSDDEREDIELSLNYQFVHEMTKLIAAIEETDFDVTQCETITTEELFAND